MLITRLCAGAFLFPVDMRVVRLKSALGMLDDDGTADLDGS